MKLLVLGTGPAQKDLIIEAKAVGLEVYACSSKKNDVGERYLDGFSQIDIRNIDNTFYYTL